VAYNWTSNQQKGLGELQQSPMPAIKVSQQLVPVSVTTVKGSDSRPAYVFDLGQNIAGVVRIGDVGQLPAGTSLTLRHSEILNKDGTVQNSYCAWPCPQNCGQGDGGNCANQTDVYIASGQAGANVSWSPTHTYHGFRYVQIEGWPSVLPAPKTDLLTGLFFHSGVTEVGNVHFKNSSMEILNQLQKAIQLTQLSNLMSLPTDCPQREKRGWMGDAQWTAGEASLNFNMSSFYTNFVGTMQNTQDVGCDVSTGGSVENPNKMRPGTYQCCSPTITSFGCDHTGTNFSTAQSLAGALPDVVPYGKHTYGGWPGDPSWMVAAVIIPWEAHRRSGDIKIISDTYDTAKALIDFLNRHVDPTMGLVQFGYYGDWLALETTPKGQVVSFSHILAVSRMVDMATILGKAADAKEYASLLASYKSRWHQAYYNATAGNYGKSQTSNILALFLDIPSYNNISSTSVVMALTDDIKAKGNALTSGALGTRYVFEVLTEHDQMDLAMALATKTTQPSFGWMLSNGPGTIWENWNGDRYTAAGSKSHPMFCGGIGLFLYAIAGLDSASYPPAFKVHSNFAKALGGARVQGAGMVADWDLYDTRFELKLRLQQESTDVTIPLVRSTHGCSGVTIREHVRGFSQTIPCSAALGYGNDNATTVISSTRPDIADELSLRKDDTGYESLHLRVQRPGSFHFEVAWT